MLCRANSLSTNVCRTHTKFNRICSRGCSLLRSSEPKKIRHEAEEGQWGACYLPWSTSSQYHQSKAWFPNSSWRAWAVLSLVFLLQKFLLFPCRLSFSLLLPSCFFLW